MLTAYLFVSGCTVFGVLMALFVSMTLSSAIPLMDKLAPHHVNACPNAPADHPSVSAFKPSSTLTFTLIGAARVTFPVQCCLIAALIAIVACASVWRAKNINFIRSLRCSGRLLSGCPSAWVILICLTSFVHCQTPGTITSIAGNGLNAFSGDGGPATSASLHQVSFMTYDPTGGLVVPDSGNNRIRRVDLTSGLITTLAGNGLAAYAGDGGLATSASLNYPIHAVYGPDGCLYISDSNSCVIRKVDAQGIISTFAGTGWF